MDIPDRVVVSAILPDDSRQARSLVARYAEKCDDLTGANEQSLLARAMLRRMITDITQTVSRDWSFSHDENGAPLALHAGKPAPLAVSISHSGRFVACAVARAEALGIDIEIHRDWRDLGDVSNFAFGPREREQVRAEGSQGFYRIWTLREALAKAIGVGLNQATDGVDRFAQPFPATGELFPGMATDDLQQWYFGYLMTMPDLSCSVAVKFGDDRRGAGKGNPTWKNISL